jgi:hypothetical protein
MEYTSPETSNNLKALWKYLKMLKYFATSFNTDNNIFVK